MILPDMFDCQTCMSACMPAKLVPVVLQNICMITLPSYEGTCMANGTFDDCQPWLQSPTSAYFVY